MTTWTTNLEVPHLDQNVAQPEIPENVAKDIFDDVFAGMYTTAMSDANYTYVYVPDPKQAQPWHNFVQEFTGTLTAIRIITFPSNNRPYLLMNNTDQILEFNTSTQAIANVTLGIGQNAYAYSDGINLFSINFAPTSTNIVDLDDVPTYDTGKVLRSLAAGTEWYDIATDLATKLNHTGGTINNLGYTEQTVTSGATPDFNVANGNIINYTNTEIATVTFSTTHSSTSFKLALTNATAFALTWPTVEWPATFPAGLTATGKDLIEFTKIGGVWIASILALNVT